jgi:valyl-tRNA synthetase
MCGFNTLWLPGMDHAGIATQNVVERELRKEGKTRHDLGREKFVERVWEWKKEYGGRILAQIRRIGDSCDWSRERFTFDEGLSQAVREVFVQLYSEGLIYRGKRLINWCPRCLTALSDLEVKYETSDSKLYHIRYPLKGKPGTFVEVATTRPETMLGDTAVAVHPDDKRYLPFKDESVILPLIGRELKFIQDTAVDPKFGTGVVKITPAHDLADFEMGLRHGLEQISVIGEDATITAAGGAYQGLDRFKAREKIVEDLEAQGLLVKVESLANSVGRCERCSTIVEPLLSTQWFVKIKPLAEPAIEAVETGRTRFIPPSWANTYFEWMRNIRDWCISRQLWWGHRIPAWYCPCGEIIVSKIEPKQCPKCGSTVLQQDNDVLDTWFSSGLWPFSTLGWPEKTADLKAFYPGSVLVTGYDIIFFWVARMMMFGMKFMGAVPFREVYITGIIRDAQRQKMSKSKGNVVDPLELCDKYGTDAVRFAFARMGAPGTDITLADDLFESYRNFATKIWNAARFSMRYLESEGRILTSSELKQMDLSLADRWILARLGRAIEEANASLTAYNLHEASRTIYRFFWHEFCDWYLEMVKLHPDSSKQVLLYVLENALRLLHPFMPFLTEELWQTIPHSGDSVMIAAYPQAEPALRDTQAEDAMEKVQDVIVKVRNIRSEKNVEPKQAVVLRIATEDGAIAGILTAAREYIFKLGNVSKLEIVPQLQGNQLTAQAVAAGCALEVPLEGLIDQNAERAKLQRELEKAQKEADSLERKLSNASFVERAPAEVVEENRRRLSDYQDQATKLRSALDRMA